MNTVRLRPLEPEDLDYLYSIENDDTLWDIGNNNVPYSRYTLYNYLSESKADIYADRQLRLIVEIASEKTPIGLADLFNFSPDNLRAEVGIVIERRYQNRGYGEEALRLLTDYCSNRLHLNQIYAIVNENNQPSNSLFLNAGFIKTARLQQWLRTTAGYKDANLYQFLIKKA